MGLVHSPRIVTDNLKICVDPANIKSYNPDVVGSAVEGGGGIATFSAQKAYTTIGTYDFKVPAGITSVSAVAVGGGGGGAYTQVQATPGAGGGGGGLSYGTFAVTPGEILSVVVGWGGTGGKFGQKSGGIGGDSQLKRGDTILLNGGAGGGADGGSAYNPSDAGLGGTSTGIVRNGGGVGGIGGSCTGDGATGSPPAGGGGGAAGYSGDGGAGNAAYSSGGDGSGGGGGGGGSDSTVTGNHGGGVGILGEGSNGSGGSHGSDGSPGSGGVGISYGGGGGGAKGGPTGPYGTWPSADGDSGSSGAVRIAYANAGTAPYSWTFSNAANNDQTPAALAYGDGKIICLFSDSDNGNTVAGGIYSTDNGTSWTAVNNSTYSGLMHNGQWQDAIYADGKFVAVSLSGAIVYSSDGISWTAATGADSNQWYSITYGNGKYVAVSRDGTYRVTYSTNGTTWSAASAASTALWKHVAYGNGKFVATAWSGTDRIMYSTDGINWSNSGITGVNDTYAIQGLEYADGKFVAINGGYLGNPSVMYSTDGINWSSSGVVGVTSSNWRDVAYGSQHWVAVADYGPDGSGETDLRKLMHSRDALNWTLEPMPATTGTDNYYWSGPIKGDGNGNFITGAYTSGGDASSTSKLLLSKIREYPSAAGTGIGDTTYTNTTTSFIANDLTGNETAILQTDALMYVKDGNLGTFEFSSFNSDYIELSGTSSLNYPITTSVTLSVFVKFNTVGSWQGIFTKNRSTNTQLGLWLTNTSKAGFYADGSGLLGATTLTTGIWYHIVCVQEANTSRKIYINDVLDGTQTSSFGTTPSGTENWMLGHATGTTDFLDGKLSQISLYDKALTLDEIHQIHNTLRRRYS